MIMYVSGNLKMRSGMFTKVHNVCMSSLYINLVMRLPNVTIITPRV